ncbi:MAG TPA: hypothetical protein VLT33_05475 [Labilithrix sp.]|nr:hypothetical protein [Labilithrix sp.]
MRTGSSPDLEYKYDTLSVDEVAAASERSPAFDVAVVASVAGFRDSCGSLPVDSSRPRRTTAGCPREMDREAKLVLSQVDGARSLGQIATCAGLTLPETIEILLHLLALGVVELEDEVPTPRA